MQEKINIFWFRRDLRLEDNAGLYYALKNGLPVLPIFIFDSNILENLTDKKDARVGFIYNALIAIQKQLNKYNSTLLVLYGNPIECFKKICDEYKIATVYTNHDYEPYAKQRDQQVANFLKNRNIDFYTFKDQVVFEMNEIVKDNKEPYTIFTPYSRKWREKLNKFHLQPYPADKYSCNFLKSELIQLPNIEELGFEKSEFISHVPLIDAKIITNYHETRNLPAINGTTKISVHLRFGTISIRKIATQALLLNETFLNELIWRDFYQMILWHFPAVINNSFKKEYDNIKWRNNIDEFHLWCNGNTGYPIVDAGMRELNSTGFMHNRVRMITASFLTKHLLIDWRWGEAYFAEKLIDYDLASNNGGWQWAAGSGCDAAPYFRIFNPYLQTQKFDTELKYIRKWVPEFEEFSYPHPIIKHEVARERCLKIYKEALQKM